MTDSHLTSFIWSVADLIRDIFKRGKYQDVILPLTVLRRIDQVLKPTKDNVLKTYSEYKGKLDNPDDLLRKASGYAFYITSVSTFERLVDDPQHRPKPSHVFRYWKEVSDDVLPR
jgi:type I restriction enzyme M protein